MYVKIILLKFYFIRSLCVSPVKGTRNMGRWGLSDKREEKGKHIWLGKSSKEEVKGGGIQEKHIEFGNGKGSSVYTTHLCKIDWYSETWLCWMARVIQHISKTW